MTIVQFQYILAVAQYKNFSVAAEKCFVTQPTLSMQVQRLEEELDVLIFDRSKKPVRVTEIGEKILKQAESIVNVSRASLPSTKALSEDVSAWELSPPLPLRCCLCS